MRAKTVVIASGVRYRRPDIPNLADFEGAGVSYWATYVEAKLCEGEEVALVGGGNSAGQAVAFLAPKVKHLHLVVRGDGLEDSMSRYLIERIDALPNVTLHKRTEIVGLEGEPRKRLTAATFRDRDSGETHRCPLHHLFLFIGADPNTAWLEDCVAVDGKGFVVTGASIIGRREWKVAGAFAARDELARRLRHRRRAGRLDQARRRGGRRGRSGRGANSQRAWRRIAGRRGDERATARQGLSANRAGAGGHAHHGRLLRAGTRRQRSGNVSSDREAFLISEETSAGVVSSRCARNASSRLQVVDSMRGNQTIFTDADRNGRKSRVPQVLSQASTSSWV